MAFAPQTPPPPPAREIELRTLWQTLWRRRIPLLIVFVAFVAFVTIFTLLQPKSYSTTVKMLAGNASTGGTATTSGAGPTTTELSVLNALVLQSGGQSPETFAELLQEMPVAQEVINKLNLRITPQQLLARTSVKPVTGTPILSLTVAWSNPKQSAEIANAFANVFVDRERELISHEADHAVGFLQKQLPSAEQHMREAQNALSEYQRADGHRRSLLSNAGSRQERIRARYPRLQTAQIEIKQDQASLATVESQLTSAPPTIDGSVQSEPNPIAGALQQQLVTAEVDLKTAQSKYTDSHPAVIAAKGRVDELKRELATQAPTSTGAISRVPNPLWQQLNQQRNQLGAQISSLQSQVVGLQQQLQSAEQNLKTLPEQTQRISQLGSAPRRTPQDVYRDAEPQISTRDERANDGAERRNDHATRRSERLQAHRALGLNLSIGILLGLIFGITTAFGLEFFDDRLRTEDDIRDRTGLPVLATIPQLGSAGEGDPVWVESMTVESFFELVTQLRYSSETPPHVVTVTSPQQGDGKSTIAINVAISMASLNAKVLIIDADLRRPSIHAKLGIANTIPASPTCSSGSFRSRKRFVPAVTAGTLWAAYRRNARPPNPVALVAERVVSTDCWRRRARCSTSLSSTRPPSVRSSTV